MKKMLILAMTMAMVLLAAAGVCETLRVGMETRDQAQIDQIRAKLVGEGFALVG